jgi:hypothetical protein
MKLMQFYPEKTLPKEDKKEGEIKNENKQEIESNINPEQNFQKEKKKLEDEKLELSVQLLRISEQLKAVEAENAELKKSKGILGGLFSKDKTKEK